MRTYFGILVLLLVFSLTACTEKESPAPENGLKIIFSHLAEDEPLITNQMIYENAAGNPYEVTEIMYFISDLTLYHNDGRIIKPSEWEGIHYTDTNIPSTLEWIAGKNIPSGLYDSLTFTFGLCEEQNQSFMFVNPPEVNMAWPEVLGGGYHYLMLNGWWTDLQEVRRPFNFHLGIGQIYENNSGQVSDITGFVHNHFTVNPTGGPFSIANEGITELTLTMHIKSWFETPFIYDHNQWGGAIMQIQEAMYIGSMNGRDAFSIKQ